MPLSTLQRPRVPAARGAARGLSLIELMVSLTLGLFLVAGMLTLLARNSSIRGELDKAGRQVENGRYAVQRLTEDIHNAGFYGEFFNTPVPGTTTFPATLPDPCDVTYTAAPFKSAMALPVQGITAVASGALTACGIDAANQVVGSNVIVLRFASPVVTLSNWGVNTADSASVAAIATLDAGLLYMQASVDDVSFSIRSNAAANFGALKVSSITTTNLINAPVYRYITRIYFISPCSRPAAATPTVCSAAADGGAPIPTLKMTELVATGGVPAFSDPVPVAEGVEQIVYDYGLDTDTIPNGSPDASTTCAGTTCTTTNWNQVVSVRVSLVARNTELSAGYVDAKTYTLGSVSYTPPTAVQGFKRHQYQAQVRVNNVSMRREQ